MKKITFLLFVLLASGCSQNVSPNTYTASEVGVVSKVVPGVIISKRAITIDNPSGLGGAAGAVGGGAAGSMVGNSVGTIMVGAVGGAVVGGVAGAVIDKGVNQRKGIEYIIRLKKDLVISVVQAQDLQFAVNQHVLILYGAMTRIIADEQHA